ncbi:MAG: DUF58 domain-containing protein [Acidimicrobiia bacterium]|nr:DUF58 domain-containing protein [Acidimicrobiia bacterium]
MSPHPPELFGAAVSQRGGDPHHHETPSLVTLSDIAEIELTILRRMRELTMGDHRSMAHGTGFDFVGLRDWQAGDRPSQIDWAQSTLTNFTPLVVRDFEQPSTASVVVVADASASTRCGVNGVPIAAPIARAIATVGMSAVFFQDTFGLVTFEEDLARLSTVRPRTGRGQVVHCLDAYERRHGLEDLRHAGSLSMTIASFMRRTALVPFVSDFLIEQPDEVLRELSLLRSTHDVFVVLVDAAFAFELPRMSAGWIDVFDVETGRTRVVSRAALARMAARVRDWQDEVARLARAADLDVVRVGPDRVASDLALAGFVIERRLKKVA